jgi:hypothetical protein
VGGSLVACSCAVDKRLCARCSEVKDVSKFLKHFRSPVNCGRVVGFAEVH